MILVDVTKEMPRVKKHVTINTMAKKLGCNISELKDNQVVVLYCRDSDLSPSFGRWRPVRAFIK